MSIVLKNLKTQLYLKNGVAWTADIAAALQFDSVVRAQRFCATHRLTDLHAVRFSPEEASTPVRDSIAA